LAEAWRKRAAGDTISPNLAYDLATEIRRPMATILEDYIAKHPGSAQRYIEASQIFPALCT